MYDSQIQSKKYRELDKTLGAYFKTDELYEQLYKKHFKSNFFFDTVVWFGIQFAKLFNSAGSRELKKVNNYFIYSHEIHSSFNTIFPFEVNYVNNLKDVKPNSEVIFDANTLSFKEIIEQISILQKNNSHTFKILPKNSNFILGSNTSKHRGEILHF